MVASVIALLVGLTTWGTALAASPSGATIGPSHPSTGWSGKVFALGATASPALCPLPADAGNVLCDHFKLSVDVSSAYWSSHSGAVSVTIRWASGSNDFDLYLYSSSGSQLAGNCSQAG